MSVNILGTDYPIATTTTLDLTDNQITDIPQSISSLINLRELYLHNNEITYIPESISSLTNLWELRLSHNKISHIPESISSLTNLLYLCLSDNHIDDLSVVNTMSFELRDFSNQTPKPLLYLPDIII